MSKTDSQKHRRALLVVSIVFAVAALATVIPNPGASWENVLGYKSLCTFVPMATAICLLLAELMLVIRAAAFGSAGRGFWLVAVMAGAALVAVIALSLPAYLDAKQDAGSGATERAAAGLFLLRVT
jgi:hypothetical protein